MLDIKSQNLRSESLYKIIVLILILSAALWLFSPVPDDGDSYTFANVVKELAQSNNWYFLSYHGKDWLDKPHFPFWVGALLFKLLGANMVSYNLSGFIFFLLGGYFCAKLAKEFYGSEAAWIAAIIYFSIVRIAISAIYTRAETFLIAELTAAIYFAWKYEQCEHISIRYLLGLAIATSCAIMTKGIFIIIAIFGSLAILWGLKKRYWRWISPRYLILYLAIAIGIIPEILSLYLQFDAHPEKAVEFLGGTYHHVSGIKWFFWGSQFGRFFNNGYITHGVPVGGGYFYFIPIFLEFFLPWTLLCLCALGSNLRLSSLLRCNSDDRTKFLYLFASFIILFILFSLSKFQVSQYITILFAFPAIITAHFLQQATKAQLSQLLRLQQGLFYVIAALISYAVLVITSNWASGMATLILMIIIGLLWHNIKKTDISQLSKLLLLLAVSFLVLYNSMMAMKSTFFRQHGIGVEITNTLRLDQDFDRQQQFPVLAYGINNDYLINELLFHTNREFSKIEQIEDIRSYIANNRHCYLLLPNDQNSQQKLLQLFPTNTRLGLYEIPRFHGLHLSERQVVALFRI